MMYIGHASVCSVCIRVQSFHLPITYSLYFFTLSTSLEILFPLPYHSFRYSFLSHFSFISLFSFLFPIPLPSLFPLLHPQFDFSIFNDSAKLRPHPTAGHDKYPNIEANYEAVDVPDMFVGKSALPPDCIAPRLHYPQSALSPDYITTQYPHADFWG